MLRPSLSHIVSLMKVLSVIPAGSAEGDFIFAKREAHALITLGVECQSFFFNPSSSMISFVQDWNRFRKRALEFDPHIIHAHYGLFTGLLTTLRRFAPTVVTFRGNDLYRSPHLPRWKDLIGKSMSYFAGARAAAIICVSAKLAELLPTPRLRRKTTIVPESVPLAVFVPSDKGEARRRLDWNLSERIVLFSGKKWPHSLVKRPDLARAAVELTRAEFPTVKLFELDGTISPNDIPNYLNAADCLLVTSETEGGPTIVKEAMACNLPVVSVDVGDVRELLRQVSPSLIVGREIPAIANGLVAVLRDGARSNGRNIAEREFSEGICAESLLAVYQTVLDKTT